MLKILFSFFFFLPCWAQVTIPSLVSPVEDHALFLSPEEKKGLADKIFSIYEKGGPQIQMLLIESLQNEPIENFSMRVAEVWKLGSKEKGNGILLVVAKNDRKIRIEVGGGIEGTLTDLESFKIIQNILKPAFKKNAYAEGLQTFLTHLEYLFLQTAENQIPTIPPTFKKYSPFRGILNLLAFFVLIILYPFYTRKLGKNIFTRGIYMAASFTLLAFLLGFSPAKNESFILVGLAGFVIGLIGPNNLLLIFLYGNVLGRSRYGSGSSGSSGSSWGGGGGGFSGGGSSGGW
ncbi:MAG: TPM domain-containing protein [Bacteriovoracaceae bacterium]|nr:TPM domain-containing protein [Bacteriovoracaceae bacterium]